MLKKFDRFTFDKGLIIHSVAVLAHEGAILLLGHSGAGKSTLSRLLAERYPIFADDNIYIAQHRFDKKWYIADAKLLQADSYDFVPLLSIIRTCQAQQHQLIKVTPRETCKNLLDAAFEAGGLWNVSIQQQRDWFAFTAEIARNYPGWRLFATLGSETPNLIWNCFQ
jgi:ABC-type dipeptide/oligopeptide/nickel transport system ATPase subunit